MTYSATALPFDYSAAFSRNVGWFTQDEQQVLRKKRVAIAGLGGVGGIHLLTLARLGIEQFTIADFDTFEIQNFNRQVGALVSTIGKPKADVLADMVKDINPDIELRIIREPVDASNVDTFLSDADIYIDSLDYFAFDARALVFSACNKKSIPAVTAAPFGMGAALLVFMPGKMTFEEYFRWEGQSPMEKGIRFFAGLSPRVLHSTYLVDPSTVNFREQRGPSTFIACELCAGITATTAIKVLLNRGDVRAAPWGIQYDAYRQRLSKTWRPGGNANPVQKIILRSARKQLEKLADLPRQ